MMTYRVCYFCGIQTWIWVLWEQVSCADADDSQKLEEWTYRQFWDTSTNWNKLISHNLQDNYIFIWDGDLNNYVYISGK